MGGFCGWVGLRSDATSDRATLEAMIEHTGWIRKDRAVRSMGPGYAVAGTDLAGRDTLAQDGDLVGVVEGSPRFQDTELHTLSRERGVGAASLRGFRDRGPDLLAVMKGEFSLAIIQVSTARAFLAIDRAGGRFPVYYRVAEGGIVFSTGVDAIQCNPHCRSELDLQAIYNYLYFHVVPGPRTARRNVHRLLPGTFLSFGDGRESVQRYWQIRYTENSSASLDDLEHQFRDLLKTSVRHAAGDDKVGCFLSGGTDSSTVAGVLSMESDSPPPTFSIGFDSKRYDEMRYARIASKEFQTEHHEYYLQPDDVVSLIPRIAAIYSEPFGNESAVPAYHCARMAQERGLERLLGGDGGDELFAGNERYAQQRIFEAYGYIPASIRRWILEPIVLGLPAGDTIWPIRKARSYIRQARVDMPDRTQSYAYLERFGAQNVLEPDFLSEVDPGEPMRLLRESYEEAQASTMVNRFMAMDLRFTIADSDLPKVSRMCELAGIRASYPLLDDDLIEFSAQLPPGMKLRGLQLRWFFKRALVDFLPREIIDKTKHGMGLPFGLWLRSHEPLRDLVSESLGRLKNRGIVQPAFIDRLTRMHRDDHAIYYGVYIWVLLQLEQWLRHHEDGR